MSYSGVKLFSEKVHELFRGLFQKWKSSWMITVVKFTTKKVDKWILLTNNLNNIHSFILITKKIIHISGLSKSIKCLLTMAYKLERS